MKNKIFRLIVSVLGSSALMFCFYMSVWVSKMTLDFKYLLSGFYIMVQFVIALITYNCLSTNKK